MFIIFNSRKEDAYGPIRKIKEPAFLKDDSEAERQFAILQELCKAASGELADQLDEEIRQVDDGIFGEKTVRYELWNISVVSVNILGLGSSLLPGISLCLRQTKVALNW